jgi:hypothetical protein
VTLRLSRDTILGLITLLAAAAYYAAADAIAASQLADAVGPAGLPKIYAAGLGVLSLVLIVRGRRPAAGSSQADTKFWRSAGLILLGVIYMVAVPWIGYLLAIAALIFGTALYQGGVDRRRAALVAAAGAVFFFVLFVVLLGIDQPAGVWSPAF